MDRHTQQVAAAFTRKAPLYDAFGEGHATLTRMRQKVYAHIEAVTAPSTHLLEINAGTGLDAVELVRRGYRVHATDIAPGMVAQIEAKIAQHDYADRLTAQQCSFTALDQVRGGPFDAVISNSGGLNCIDDLGGITRHLPDVLRPGGVVTWVIMPPICPWELATALKDFRTGIRRLSGQTVANVEGVEFLTTYYTPRQVRAALGPAFRPLRQEGLLIATPPADNKTFARRHPRLYRGLVWAEDRLAHLPPFNAWGDFFILSMRYVP